MNGNETYMKLRGESRVWKATTSKLGGLKKVSSMQIGQQILFDEALTILFDIRNWIEKTSALIYRKELKDYFVDDEILLQKITETFLLLASSSYVDRQMINNSTMKLITRHKRIRTVNEKLMPELSFDQVWRFLEVIIDASEYFDIDKKITHKNGKILTSVRYVCTLSDVILCKLAIEADLAFFPQPMLKKPIAWSYENNKLIGGYEDYQYQLVRSASLKIDYNRYSENIFNAVNYIQSTPWRINKALVVQVKEDLNIPVKEDFIKSTFPCDIESNWEMDLTDTESGLAKGQIEKISAARTIYAEQAELYNAEARDFESALGKYRAVKLALGLAEMYIDEKEIYFPHSYDFRGRIYPLPVGLSPQGSDPVKAMLEYAVGEPLTQVGEDWCWAYLASLYGEDKLPFEERIVLGKELIHKDYKEADEPYQFLAHQLEMQEYIKDTKRDMHVRVHLDACNSGSQFTSAMTGDIKGCIATNVISTIDEDGVYERKDAYLLVADKAYELTTKLAKQCEEGEEKEVLKLFRSLLKKEGRKICKTPVMVSNYGGTAGGRSEILWNMMRELGVDRKWITKKNASLFSRIIGDSITGVLNGGKAFEKYIHRMNNIIAKKNKPVIWETIDGFYIIHKKNKELKRKQVSCMLPSSRKPTTINKKVFSDNLSPVKMKSAISPNYVHSQDAVLVRRTALSMQQIGIKYSDWIHDSFGCHPNYVEEMLMLTKIEFRDLMESEPLVELDRQLRLQADKSKSTQKALSQIQIPNLGDVDHNEVMTSKWFFS